MRSDLSFYGWLKNSSRIVLGTLFRCHVYDCPKKLPEGPLVLCSNHLSVLDAILLASHLDRQIVFLAKKELFENKILNFIFTKCGVIPLARDGTDIASVRSAVNTLKNGGFVCIFPQGTRCRTECENTEPKSGAGLLVSLGRAKVICAGIYAKNYKVKIFRKTKIVFGAPREIIVPEGISGREKNDYITNDIFSEIISLSHKAKEIR